MALTIHSYEYSVFGNKPIVIAAFSFQSSYSFGGEELDYKTLFGLNNVHAVLIENKAGFRFEYDNQNKKIKAFMYAPPIVYDEVQTADVNYNITLDYPPAFIMNVCGPGDNLAMRSSGIAYASLSASQCSLTAQLSFGSRATFIVAPVTLVSNGTFTGNATGWTLASGWQYSSNTVLKNGNGTGTLAEDAFAAVVGHTYQVTYTISSWTVGTVTPSLGGVTGTAVGADGTYTERFTATSTAGIAFTPTNTARFTIDNVIVQDMTIYTTYVTQAWKDVWDNLVQEESVTLSSGGTANLSYTPIAVMYADQITATAGKLILIDEDDTAASGEVAIYLGASTAQIKATHADQNAKVAKITYLKKPTSGFLANRYFKNETATKAGSDPYTNTFDYPLLLWGYSGQVPVNTGTTQVLIEYSGTPAAGEAVIDYFTAGARGAGAPATGFVIGCKSNVTMTGAGIWGDPRGIPGLIPLQVKNGENLSSISSIRMLLIGR